MSATDGLPSTERAQWPQHPAPFPGSAFPEVPEAGYGEGGGRHLRDYLRVLYKYRWLAAVCFALTVGVTALLTFLATPFYTATTRLHLARQSPIQLRLQGDVLSVDETDRSANTASTFLATQVAVLQSRDLAERAIRMYRLAENEVFLRPGSGRRSLLSVSGRLLSVVRPRGWKTSQELTPLRESAASAQIEPALVHRYRSYLTVRDVRSTDIVEVTFTTPSPALSALLAAVHTQAYVEANEEARRATDVTAKEFLGQQLLESRDHLERAQATLGRFASENPNVAINEEQKTIAQRISELSSLITKAEGTRVGLQSRYEFLINPKSDPVAYFLDRPGIQRIQLALNDLRTQRTVLNSRLGPNHEQMLALGVQEAELKRQLRSVVEQEVASVRSRYEAAVLREEQLRHKLTQNEDTAIGLRGLGARYDLLKKDVESARGLHESLLKQQLETSVKSELTASNIRIVERAEVPGGPSKPNTSFNLVLGTFIGLILAVSAAFTCEYFDNSVKSTEELQAFLQLPTLATIPNFELARRAAPGYGRTTQADTGNGNYTRVAAIQANDIADQNGGTKASMNGKGRELVVLHEPRSVVAEAFRSMRTAVLFSVPGAPPKVILVTSAVAGEGKTVSSLNLATTLADRGSRVLLLDADLRRPSCHRPLGVENRRGLSSFLAGQAELESVIHTFSRPSFFFIPSGPTPPNPADLIGSVRMRDALQQLQASYDFVIVDSPPVLAVTDSIMLARATDGVVLVVKGQDTPREVVRRARDVLLQTNARLLGAVVNNVDLGWDNLYFHNRYGGYYYAHSPDLETPA